MPSLSLYNPEIEADSLAILLQFPETFADFYLIDRLDWSKAHQCLWDIVSQQLGQNPQGSVSPLFLSERLKGYGITLEGGFDSYEYLQGLTIRYVEKNNAGHFARELKRLTVRRSLVNKLELAKNQLVQTPNISFEDMSKLVEQSLTEISTDYYRGDNFESIFEDFVGANEKRAANPINANNIGWMGPFSTINKTLGALLAPGLFVTIGARTGNQKSALGFAYHVHIAEKLNIPVLLMDCGEMTRERIRDRAACCLSNGKVPLWAIKSGEWAQNKEWAQIMREDVYPRIPQLMKNFHYINIGHLSPKEKIQLIRRYYYNRIGRGNPLALLDDYLKGVESLGRNIAEYQAVGYYVNDVKNLITNEIPASFWTSVQNNRTGSYQGKAVKDITESEDQMGLSDRIIQQSDWGFILRWKVPEELGLEKELFGNMRLSKVKAREAMGKEFEKCLRPIKLPNGKFADNYFHLHSRNFFFEEKGDLRLSLETLGNSVVDLGINDPKDKKIQPL